MNFRKTNKNMKTLENGQQVEILKVYRNASNLTKIVNKETVYADLLKVRMSDGQTKIINELELNS